ncbi:MAG: tyrosine-type recombinase/integrase [Planctomycetota bacterium]|jgi:integrase
MAKKRRKQTPKDLPGALYQRNGRWWWRAQLPGDEKVKAQPLKPVGSRYATTDHAVAVECAREMLQQHLFKKDIPFQGEVHTIPDLVRAYMAFAKEYYVDSTGETTVEVGNIAYTMKVLLDCFPALAVDEFGPLRLKTVREAMIDKNWCRTQINRRVGVIRRMFKWAVSEQIVSPVILHGLQAVTALKRGRTRAKESKGVKPVDEKDVYAILPHTTPVVAAMIELQLLTGMRPTEMCLLRPCDLDRSEAVWHYYPEKHKNQYRNIERIVAIGPRGQELLTPYLLRAEDAYCFSPVEAEKQRRQKLTAQRKTPLSYGNRVGTNRKDDLKRTTGDQYDSKSYRRAVQYAIAACNKARRAKAKAAGVKPDIVPKWTPYQMRHTTATKVRKEMGYECAGATLGHTNMSATAIYAERNQGLADEAAKRFG